MGDSDWEITGAEVAKGGCNEGNAVLGGSNGAIGTRVIGSMSMLGMDEVA